jgi:hypothetical protein
MLAFADLLEVVPEIAFPIRDRLASTSLAILGTLRSDGSPRLSPIEVTFFGGGLYMGMMPGSLKCVDARRDPRVCVLTPVADKDDLGGEGKLFGALREVTQDAARLDVLRHAVEGLDIDPSLFGDSPVFEVLVDAAAWQHVEDETFVTLSWNSTNGLRLRHRVGPTGMPVDVD